MINALILDCGGVLCRPRRGHWLLPTDMEDILGRALPAFGRERALAAHAKCAHYLDEGQFVTSEGHEIELRLKYTRAMNALLGAGLTPSQELAVARSLTLDDTRYEFYEDAHKYVELWRERYTVGILSNAMPSLARALFASGLSKHMSCMLISTFCGCQKPDARIYELCLAEIGAAPGETVFVDDTEANLLAAGRAGMRAVRMQRDVYTLDAPPEFTSFRGPVARDFKELDALINHGAV